MYVEIHDNLKDAVRLPASRVVVYDKYDNPISITIKNSDGHYICIDAGDKAFDQVLKTLGIDRTVIVNRISKL